MQAAYMHMCVQSACGVPMQHAEITLACTRAIHTHVYAHFYTHAYTHFHTHVNTHVYTHTLPCACPYTGQRSSA